MAHPAAPLWPRELVTSLLTEALVARGMDVTLFATADSETAGTLAAVCPRPYSEDPSIDAKVWELLHVAHVFERAGEFDLIHNQADFVPLAFSRLVATPMVTTIHGFSSERILPVFARYNDRVSYVSISDADRHPSLNYAATIHHGIPLDDFPFDPPGGKLAVLRPYPFRQGCGGGDRGSAPCGPEAGHGRHYPGSGLFQSADRPGHRRQAGNVSRADRGIARTKTLGEARALLHLINFDEPFGLSVIEAMACGTPVIAFKRGSMPELIEHRVTGFLVETLDEAVEAIGRIGEIDRASCRAAVMARFTVDRMADRYVSLYRSLLERA